MIIREDEFTRSTDGYLNVELETVPFLKNFSSLVLKKGEKRNVSTTDLI